MGDLDDGSYVIVLDETDGSPIWKTRIGEAGGHKRYPGPRGTPTIDNGDVFVLNQYADVVCLDAESGTTKWSVNLVDEYGGKMMSGWKYSESPLVDGDQVICTPGGTDGTLLALNRKTGEKLWQTKGWTDPAGYSSVIIATIDGTRQYVQLTGKSVAGIDPNSGTVLWQADQGRQDGCYLNTDCSREHRVRNIRLWHRVQCFPSHKRWHELAGRAALR